MRIPFMLSLHSAINLLKNSQAGSKGEVFTSSSLQPEYAKSLLSHINKCVAHFERALIARKVGKVYFLDFIGSFRSPLQYQFTFWQTFVPSVHHKNIDIPATSQISSFLSEAIKTQVKEKEAPSPHYYKTSCRGKVEDQKFLNFHLNLWPINPR